MSGVLFQCCDEIVWHNVVLLNVFLNGEKVSICSLKSKNWAARKSGYKKFVNGTLHPNNVFWYSSSESLKRV